MDHVQFLITELPDGDGENGEPGDVTRPSEPLNPADDFEPLSYETRISPATFCKAFPFHVMMDSDLKVIQVQNLWQIQDFPEGRQPQCWSQHVVWQYFLSKTARKKELELRRARISSISLGSATENHLIESEKKYFPWNGICTFVVEYTRIPRLHRPSKFLSGNVLSRGCPGISNDLLNLYLLDHFFTFSCRITRNTVYIFFQITTKFKYLIRISKLIQNHTEVLF